LIIEKKGGNEQTKTSQISVTSGKLWGGWYDGPVEWRILGASKYPHRPSNFQSDIECMTWPVPWSAVRCVPISPKGFHKRPPKNNRKISRFVQFSISSILFCLIRYHQWYFAYCTIWYLSIQPSNQSLSSFFINFFNFIYSLIVISEILFIWHKLE